QRRGLELCNFKTSHFSLPFPFAAPLVVGAVRARRSANRRGGMMRRKFERSFKGCDERILNDANFCSPGSIRLTNGRPAKMRPRRKQITVYMRRVSKALAFWLRLQMRARQPLRTRSRTCTSISGPGARSGGFPLWYKLAFGDYGGLLTFPGSSQNP